MVMELGRDKHWDMYFYVNFILNLVKKKNLLLYEEEKEK